MGMCEEFRCNMRLCMVMRFCMGMVHICVSDANNAEVRGLGHICVSHAKYAFARYVQIRIT